MSQDMNGAEAVELTPEQRQRLWAEVRGEREAATGALPPAETPPADNPLAAEPAPAPAATAPAEPEPPRQKTLEEVNAELERFKASMERRVRNAEGRAGSASEEARRLNEQLQQANQRLQELQTRAAPTPDEVSAAAGSESKWAQLSKDYPEWAEAFEERLAKQQAAQPNVDPRKLVEEATQKIAGDFAREAQRLRKSVVNAVHPGWEDLCKTREFNDWLKTGDDEIARLSNSADPADAIRLLNRYRFGVDDPLADRLPSARTAADVTRERQQRLATAATPPRGTAGSALPKSEQDMTGAEYWAYLREQRRRQREGAR